MSFRPLEARLKNLNLVLRNSRCPKNGVTFAPFSNSLRYEVTRGLRQKLPFRVLVMGVPVAYIVLSSDLA